MFAKIVKKAAKTKAVFITRSKSMSRNTSVKIGVDPRSTMTY